MVHQEQPYGNVGLFFCCSIPERCEPKVHHRGTRTAAQATAACGGSREPEQGQRSQRRRPAQGTPADAGTATRIVPAVLRPGRQKRSSGPFLERGSLRGLIGGKGDYRPGLGSPRESLRCVAVRKNLTGATRCTIPFGAGSAFARALRFASRGPVAKNAPLERFINAPADGAPRTALRKRRAVFVCSIPECCEPNGRQHTAGVESYAVSRRGGFIPERFLDAPTEETSITPFHH